VVWPGLIVDHLGYSAAFLAASAVAATALLVLAGLMPETRESASSRHGRSQRVMIRLWAYCRVGVPLTLLNGMLWPSL
jgi:predicted MFS family arabinose efflux permease